MFSIMCKKGMQLQVIGDKKLDLTNFSVEKKNFVCYTKETKV